MKNFYQLLFITFVIYPISLSAKTKYFQPNMSLKEKYRIIEEKINKNSFEQCDEIINGFTENLSLSEKYLLIEEFIDNKINMRFSVLSKIIHSIKLNEIDKESQKKFLVLFRKYLIYLQTQPSNLNIDMLTGLSPYWILTYCIFEYMENNPDKQNLETLLELYKENKQFSPTFARKTIKTGFNQ